MNSFQSISVAWMMISASQLCVDAITTFTIPARAPANCPGLDPAPVAFSFEFPYFPQYLQNISNTLNCLSTLKDVTGIWPRIHLGGSTKDKALFAPSLPVAVNLSSTFSEASVAEYPTFSYGPKFLKLVASYGGNAVLGLDRGQNNLSNTIEAAKAAHELTPNLYAFELGNEPDIFGYLAFPIAPNASTWTPPADASSEAQWQTAIGEAVGQEHIIQAGNFYLPPAYNYSAQYLLSSAAEEATGLKWISTFSHHNYPQTVANNATVSLPQLMSHVNITADVAQYAADVSFARSKGVEYVFGETNSVSGGGSPVFSPTFGAAIWVLDYVMRSVSTAVGVKRLYFHHGATDEMNYVWWTEEGVRSPYYGGYVAATALAGATCVVPLDGGSDEFAGYAVFDQECGMRRVVLVNTEYYGGNGTRPIEQFALQGVEGRHVMARRLTSNSALSRQDEGENPTIGGQSFSNETCRLTEDPLFEVADVKDGSVSFVVSASEALIVEFD